MFLRQALVNVLIRSHRFYCGSSQWWHLRARRSTGSNQLNAHNWQAAGQQEVCSKRRFPKWMPEIVPWVNSKLSRHSAKWFTFPTSAPNSFPPALMDDSKTSEISFTSNFLLFERNPFKFTFNFLYLEKVSLWSGLSSKTSQGEFVRGKKGTPWESPSSMFLGDVQHQEWDRTIKGFQTWTPYFTMFQKYKSSFDMSLWDKNVQTRNIQRLSRGVLKWSKPR